MLANGVTCHGAQKIYDSTAWYPLQGLVIGQNVI